MELYFFRSNLINGSVYGTYRKLEPDRSKAPTSMNQVPCLGFFSCLWLRIIKKGRREKEEKEKKKRKKKERKEEKRFINSNLNFQALFSLASSLY